MKFGRSLKRRHGKNHEKIRTTPRPSNRNSEAQPLYVHGREGQNRHHWLHGFRALAHVWDGNCELISRKRNAYKSFQDLRDNVAKLKVQNAVIDGELVCLDAEGRSIFNELLFRRGSPIFYAFDLLYLNGRDLRQLPLIDRKEKLRVLIEKSAVPDVICGKYVEGRGVDLFNEVVRRNLEGVVAKRKTGTYATISGWLKIKNP